MARSVNSKASATGVAKSAKGQANAAAMKARNTARQTARTTAAKPMKVTRGKSGK